jgi:hypothetical protein
MSSLQNIFEKRFKNIIGVMHVSIDNTCTLLKESK